MKKTVTFETKTFLTKSYLTFHDEQTFVTISASQPFRHPSKLFKTVYLRVKT